MEKKKKNIEEYTIDEYVRRIYIYLRRHYGDEFIGYPLSCDNHGIVEGRISGIKFSIICWNREVDIETYFWSDRLVRELSKLIKNLIGENALYVTENYSNNECKRYVIGLSKEIEGNKEKKDGFTKVMCKKKRTTNS